MKAGVIKACLYDPELNPTSARHLHPGRAHPGLPPHPEPAYRPCLGLINLARRYGSGGGLRAALACGAISHSSVKSILVENLDRLPLAEPGPVPSSAVNARDLRGPHYYAAADDGDAAAAGTDVAEQGA